MCLNSKAVTIFENDERFTAVERNRDREDLFESYIVELERKVMVHQLCHLALADGTFWHCALNLGVNLFVIWILLLQCRKKKRLPKSTVGM